MSSDQWKSIYNVALHCTHKLKSCQLSHLHTPSQSLCKVGGCLSDWRFWKVTIFWDTLPPVPTTERCGGEAIVARVRHEWCHFMNACMGKCTVEHQRMLTFEIHSAAAGSRGSPKREVMQSAWSPWWFMKAVKISTQTISSSLRDWLLVV